MTRRREIEHRLHMFEEVRSIMSSMKTLAVLETHKLERYLDTQRRALRTITAAAADFAGFHPLPATAAESARVWVLIGSERGFCGDFNETIIEALAAHENVTAAPPTMVTVGAKLTSRLRDKPHIAARLDGPSMGEEVETVIVQLVDTLNRLQSDLGALSVGVLHHAGREGELRTQHVLPPFQDLAPARDFGHAPLLNLDADTFFAELVDQFLFAALHEMFYASLMAENYRRVRHLEGAIRHLEEHTAQLSLKRNILRQEEITEELEVIMLSADALGSGAGT
jgi:F-type H+-transporting ATPase subunit gamma